MKDLELKVIAELIKDSRNSDREIAKKLHVSQPTVTRARTKLEKSGFIQEYTTIPEFTKLGYELLVITFMSFNQDRPELFRKAREWVDRQPSVIFANNGLGKGMNSVMISLHKEYGSYTNLVKQLREDWSPNLIKDESFLISLDRPDIAIKPLSLSNLLKHEV